MVRGIIRFVTNILILVGICAIWEMADVAMYGYSQYSVADCIAAVLITKCLDTKIWEK